MLDHLKRGHPDLTMFFQPPKIINSKEILDLPVKIKSQRLFPEETFETVLKRTN